MPLARALRDAKRGEAKLSDARCQMNTPDVTPTAPYKGHYYKGKGECDFCPDSGRVALYLVRQGDLSCATCIDKEEAAEQIAGASKVIAQARIEDRKIEVIKDIYNAKVTATVAIKEAINADETVPADQKHYTYFRALQERRANFAQIIKDAQQEVLVCDTEMHSTLKFLTADQRAKYQELDNKYVVKTPKTVKPKSSAPAKPNKSGFTTAQNRELKEVCAKFSVPSYAVQQEMVKNKKLNYEQAAKIVADRLAKFDAETE